MSPAEVADVEGVLFTAAIAVMVGLVLAVAVSSQIRRAVLDEAVGTGSALAAGLALAATGGSLWFSEVAGFPPCQLCWYQRFAMYPLTVIFGLAAVRSSAIARITGLGVATVGLAVSAWHNVIETFPDLDTGSCDPSNPCTIRWVEGLGFWTIPRMAAAAFALIIAFGLTDHLARPRKAST